MTSLDTLPMSGGRGVASSNLASPTKQSTSCQNAQLRSLRCGAGHCETLCGSIQMIWSALVQIDALEPAVDSPDGGGQPRFDHTAVDAAGRQTGRRRALLAPGHG